jgi:hypothetical protein
VTTAGCRAATSSCPSPWATPPSGLFLAYSGLIDQVTYPTAVSGVSYSLDPDSRTSGGNDAAASWCPGFTPYGAGGAGTPGAANRQCIPAGMCDTGIDAFRPIVSPAPGDLVITEVHANPSASTETGHEWFEVLVNRDVDLNGLEMGEFPAEGADDVIASRDCMRVEDGDYAVFSNSDPELPDGSLGGIDAFFDFGLTNSNSGLFIGIDGTTLDAVTWGASMPNGVARQLSDDTLDRVDNDEDVNWCAAEEAYNGDLGTPGEANLVCVRAGECRDGGVVRDLRVPAPGDLIITEIMADATGADGGREWFEVLVGKDLDLNGVTLTNGANTFTYGAGQSSCIEVDAGYRVFVNDDVTDHGSLSVDFLYPFQLGNDPATITLSGRRGNGRQRAVPGSGGRGGAPAQQHAPRRGRQRRAGVLVPGDVGLRRGAGHAGRGERRVSVRGAVRDVRRAGDGAARRRRAAARRAGDHRDLRRPGRQRAAVDRGAGEGRLRSQLGRARHPRGRRRRAGPSTAIPASPWRRARGWSSPSRAAASPTVTSISTSASRRPAGRPIRGSSSVTAARCSTR